MAATPTPTKDEVSAMLKNPAVMISAIIGATVLGLGLLAVIGTLLYYGKDTAALLTLGNMILTAAGLAKTYNVSARTARIEQQTNGVNSRLMDHALGPQPTAEQ